MKSLFNRFRYKVTHLSKFPKGNLVATMRNLAQRGFEPKHIIDVGANRGKWSRDARKVFPDCHFTLIEPQIEMKSYLDRFCRNDHCQWIQAGAADENGSLMFTATPDTFASSFAYGEQQAADAGLPRREVPVYTLDHIVESRIKAIPDIVKIDAEGFEVKVLQGSQSLLGKTELFFLEAHLLGGEDDPCSMIELTRIMSDYGYAPYDFTWFSKFACHANAIGFCEIAFALKSGVLRNVLSRSQRPRSAQKRAA